MQEHLDLKRARAERLAHEYRAMSEKYWPTTMTPEQDREMAQKKKEIESLGYSVHLKNMTLNIDTFEVTIDFELCRVN